MLPTFHTAIGVKLKRVCARASDGIALGFLVIENTSCAKWSRESRDHDSMVSHTKACQALAKPVDAPGPARSRISTRARVTKQQPAVPKQRTTLESNAGHDGHSLNISIFSAAAYACAILQQPRCEPPLAKAGRLLAMHVSADRNLTDWTPRAILFGSLAEWLHP